MLNDNIKHCTTASTAVVSIHCQYHGAEGMTSRPNFIGCPDNLHGNILCMDLKWHQEATANRNSICKWSKILVGQTVVANKITVRPSVGTVWIDTYDGQC